MNSQNTTRKANQKNNIYIPSTTKMPNLNLSYVKNKNMSLRNHFNLMSIGVNFSDPKKANMTPKQFHTRKLVARKMALGQPVSWTEKIDAGILQMPKPIRSKGGKRTRKATRKRRLNRRL